MTVSLRKSRKMNQKGRRINLFRMESLEPRMLLSGNGVLQDAAALVGPVLNVDSQPVVGAVSTAAAASASALAAITYSTLPNGLPILNSYPNNPSQATIFLDFDGDTTNPMGNVLHPYDLDGDPTTYNATEQANIVEGWRQTVVYFAMFDVNVTTIQPNVSTTPTAWIVPNPDGVGNWSYVNVFPNDKALTFIYQDDVVGRKSVIAHELGHNFGCEHTSVYDTWGAKTAEYSGEFDALHGPLMGVDYAGVIHKWTTWHNASGPTSLQDDIAVIKNSIVAHAPSGYTGDGFRLDGANVDNAHATALSLGTQTTDILERLADSDYFSLNVTAAGRYSFTVGRDLPSGVDTKISIYNASGTLLASEDGDPRTTPLTMINDEHLAIDLSAGTYYAVIQSHGNYGDVGQYTLRADALPSGWQSEDIGLVGWPGYSGYNSATQTYTVAGSGSDIWGTSDGAQMAYQVLSGNGSITARINSVSTSDYWAKGGVMIRDSLNADARYADVIYSPHDTVGGIYFQYRDTTAGESYTNSSNESITAPYWVRLTRSGSTFTAEISSDGASWSTLGSQTITMGTNVYIGLVNTAHNNELESAATFTNVSLTGTLNPGLSLTTTITSPTSFSTTSQTANSVALSWPAKTGTGYAGYSIERSSDGVNFTQIWTRTTAGSGTITYTSSGLADAQRYFYRLRCRKSDGTFSSDFKALNAVTKAGAVSNLRTMSISRTQITLDWTEGSGEGSYQIQRSSNGTSGWTTRGTVAANATSFTDTGLTANTRYYYRVNTLVGSTVTATSSVVNRYTRVSPVTGLAFSSITPTQLVMTWSSYSGATSYNIERSTNNNEYYPVYSGTARTFTDTDIVAGGTYYYRVTATTSTTRSEFSAAISTTVPASAAAMTVLRSDANTVGSLSVSTLSAPVVDGNASVKVANYRRRALVAAASSYLGEAELNTLAATTQSRLRSAAPGGSAFASLAVDAVFNRWN